MMVGDVVGMVRLSMRLVLLMCLIGLDDLRFVCMCILGLLLTSCVVSCFICLFVLMIVMEIDLVIGLVFIMF